MDNEKKDMETPWKTPQEKQPTAPSIKKSVTPFLFGMQILMDFGFIIALPVVLFTWFGKKLDVRFETKPLFLIMGFALAFLLSAISIHRKAKKYGKIYKNI